MGYVLKDEQVEVDWWCDLCYFDYYDDEDFELDQVDFGLVYYWFDYGYGQYNGRYVIQEYVEDDVEYQ